MDPTKRLNIGIHGTFANTMDHQRRALIDPILGHNMYRTCEVLLGEHPGEILPMRVPTPSEYLYGVGGPSWVLENFYRALWHHFVESDRLLGRIGELSWCALSSIMLHFYTLHTGQVASRARALEYLIDHSSLPATFADDVRLVHANHERPVTDQELAAAIVNGAMRVSKWMMATLSRRVGIALPKGAPLPVSRPIPSGAPIGELLGRALDWRETHLWIDPAEDFYNQFRGVVAAMRSRQPHSTALELPEFIGWAIANNHDAAERLYFWTPFNVLRYLLSDDFGVMSSIRFLDAGAGTGTWSNFLLRLGDRIEGVALDLNTSMLKVAHRKLRSAGHEQRVEIVEGNLEHRGACSTLSYSSASTPRSPTARATASSRCARGARTASSPDSRHACLGVVTREPRRGASPAGR